MNKFFKLITLICCFALNIEAMERPFSKFSKAELKMLILKSLPYSVIGSDETKKSKTYSARLFFLNASIECKNYHDSWLDDYCFLSDWDTGEPIALFDKDARELYMALYAQNLNQAGTLDYYLIKKKRGLEECRKLLPKIEEIKRIIKHQENKKEILEMDFPFKLRCKEEFTHEGKRLVLCFIGEDSDCFEGSACWDILEERLAELEKEKEEELK